MKTVLIIPTYNAGQFFNEVASAIKRQTVQPDTIFIVDSSSSDTTCEIANLYGFITERIDKKIFNHGLTRQRALERFKDCDIAIFMTQDAMLADDFTFEKLLARFDNINVAAAYGRQLTDNASSMLEKSSRAFNYPAVSRVKTAADIKELGLNAAFCSDSFAAYRVVDVFEQGGFTETDFGEDMLMAAKLLLAGKSIAYVADSAVYHSHPYSLSGEFSRGMAIGRMHRQNIWLLERFGSAESRGAALLSNKPFRIKILLALLAVPKYIGYVIAKHMSSILPKKL